MTDVLTELKDLSEILYKRKMTTLPKAHGIVTMFVKRIKNLNKNPGQHAADASQAEEVMGFKREQLTVNWQVSHY